MHTEAASGSTRAVGGGLECNTPRVKMLRKHSMCAWPCLPQPSPCALLLGSNSKVGPALGLLQVLQRYIVLATCYGSKDYDVVRKVGCHQAGGGTRNQ